MDITLFRVTGFELLLLAAFFNLRGFSVITTGQPRRLLLPHRVGVQLPRRAGVFKAKNQAKGLVTR